LLLRPLRPGGGVGVHVGGAARGRDCSAAVHGLTRAPAAGMLWRQRRATLSFDPKSIDELAHRLAEAVPPGLTALRDELEQNFKAVLQAGLAKLDLVTRREFDVQSAVLRRSRERLEELERRIAALEKPGPKG
jgi:BMFP domain-containing protein YqiC